MPLAFLLNISVIDVKTQQTLINYTTNINKIGFCTDIYDKHNKKEAYSMERETTPSQSEWLVMEVFWANETSMAAKEVMEKMQENNASGDIFIVFGGFYKFPGIGGIGVPAIMDLVQRSRW